MKERGNKKPTSEADCRIVGSLMTLLRGAETLGTEYERVRHGGTEVSVRPVNGGQYEFRRAGVSSRHRYVSVRRVGKAHDDGHHRREVRRTVDELQHVLESQLTCSRYTSVAALELPALHLQNARCKPGPGPWSSLSISLFAL